MVQNNREYYNIIILCVSCVGICFYFQKLNKLNRQTKCHSNNTVFEDTSIYTQDLYYLLYSDALVWEISISQISEMDIFSGHRCNDATD